MIFVSKFGYTLYLIHFPIYLFVFGILQTHISSSFGMAVSMGFISMMLSLLIAHFSAKWLERKEFFLKHISSSPLLHIRGMRGRQ
jgi:peptidoglycan/LPS O-acetylase OafA/YrhL